MKLNRYNLEQFESGLEINPSPEYVKLMAQELLDLKYRKLPYEPEKGKTQ
jgi:hypothetical protein